MKTSSGCWLGFFVLLLVGAIAVGQVTASAVGGGVFIHLLGFIGAMIGAAVVGLLAVIVLWSPPEYLPSERIKELQEQVRFRPDDVRLLDALGDALADGDRRDDAAEIYQSALQLRPDDPSLYVRLGRALAVSRPDDAVHAYQEALRLSSGLQEVHYDLGLLLRETGRPEEAIAAFREVLRRNPVRSQGAYENLGFALRDLGRFDEAIAAFREANRVFKARFGPEFQANPRVDATLRETEQLSRAVERLPAILEGRERPVDGAECLVFAQLCQLPYLKQYAAAGRFFDEAFALQPDLADDLKQQHRYNAARFAARVGCSLSGDSAGLDDKERGRLRRRALDWLQADLKAWRDLLVNAPDDIDSLNRVSLAMQEWLMNHDLAGVRGPVAFSKLREAERQPWQELWHHVSATRERADRRPI